MRLRWIPAVALALLASACGSSGSGTTSGTGNSRLSASAYQAQLKTIAKESDAAQHAVEKGFHANSVPRLVAVLATFGATEKRIGDQVAALDPPTNAEAANTELAKGEHDTASELQAVLPKVKKMPSAQAAISYLSRRSTTAGGQEIDQALAKLKQLGYIKHVS
jgi:hypothetical protein